MFILRGDLNVIVKNSHSIGERNMKIYRLCIFMIDICPISNYNYANSSSNYYDLQNMK